MERALAKESDKYEVLDVCTSYARFLVNEQVWVYNSHVGKVIGDKQVNWRQARQLGNDLESLVVTASELEALGLPVFVQAWQIPLLIHAISSIGLYALTLRTTINGTDAENIRKQLKPSLRRALILLGLNDSSATSEMVLSQITTMRPNA